MGTLIQDFKRQASFFLREKIKTARLVLTDATPAQLLTEEVINGDSIAANGHAMRVISRAAFEVDDYDRIVQILHQRLAKFERWNWRASYKALVVLEHLLTHGPRRIAEEFEDDEDCIRDMASFNYVDDKGFNWGLSVKNKSERILQLLEDEAHLKEERAKARKLIVGIKGFGSLSHNDTIDGRSSKEDIPDSPLRSKSLGLDRPVEENDYSGLDDEYAQFLVTRKMAGRNEFKGWPRVYGGHDYVKEEDHPFWDKEHQTRVSLLSSV